MVQVELSRIIIDEERQDQVIVLKEKEGERQIPIIIGIILLSISPQIYHLAKNKKDRTQLIHACIKFFKKK